MTEARRFVDCSRASAERAGERGGVRFDTPWAAADLLAADVLASGLLAGAETPWWGDPCVGTGRLVVAVLEAAAAEGPKRFARLLEAAVGIDVDAAAVEVAERALRLIAADAIGRWPDARVAIEGALHRREPFRVGDGLAWLSERPPGGVVITNPPFESVRSLHRRVGPVQVQAMRAAHPECRGAFDYAVPFIARALDVTRGGGLVAVVPAAWLATDYAAALRTQLDAAGPWKRLDNAQVRFPANVHVALVSNCGARGRSMVWTPESDVPAGTVPLGSLARVASGTPGFSAGQIAEALTESRPARGWPFATVGSLKLGGLDRAAVRAMGRTVRSPWLPRAAVRAESRRLLYDGEKLLIPGICREPFGVISRGPLALGVGVLAVHDSAHLDRIARSLNGGSAGRWLTARSEGLRLSGGYRRLSASLVRMAPVEA